MAEDIELENEDFNADGDIENSDVKENIENDAEDKKENGNADNTSAEKDDKGLSGGGQDIYGAPENYDYKEVQIPKGMKYNEEVLKEFNDLNRETNLSQAQANKYLNLGIKLAQKHADNMPALLKQITEAKVAQYKQALNTDKEIGGGDKNKINAYLDVADKGYSAFASNEVKAIFKETGLNYHPAVIKMFHRLGELTGDDKIFVSKTPAGTTVDAAEILYGKA